jgi:hypothetical protein
MAFWKEILTVRTGSGMYLTGLESRSFRVDRLSLMDGDLAEGVQ